MFACWEKRLVCPKLALVCPGGGCCCARRSHHPHHQGLLLVRTLLALTLLLELRLHLLFLEPRHTLALGHVLCNLVVVQLLDDRLEYQLRLARGLRCGSEQAAFLDNVGGAQSGKRRIESCRQIGWLGMLSRLGGLSRRRLSRSRLGGLSAEGFRHAGLGGLSVEDSESESAFARRNGKNMRATLGPIPLYS